jgi:large subunit ribosomal protein L22
MISRASVSFVRIAPRKVRYVIDLIRAKSVPQAQIILAGSPRRAGEIVKKLLDQAVDAAQRNSQLAADKLVVSKVLADGGPSMKRFRAATMGRANRIKKRTSHIQIELDLKGGAVVPAKSAAKAAPVKKTEPPAAPKAKKSGLKKLVGAK